MVGSGSPEPFHHSHRGSAEPIHNKLEISLAGFWYEIQDYQIKRYVLGGFGVFTADQVASRGAELEFLWRPTHELEFSAGIGYVDAEFTNHRDALTGENLAGRRAPYIPNFTGHFAAQYRHESGFLARVDWLLTGRTFFDEANTKNAAQSSYGLLNARIGYEQPHWGIYLYGKNLTDAEYYTLKIPTLSVGIPSEPRSIGMMAEVKF